MRKQLISSILLAITAVIAANAQTAETQQTQKGVRSGEFVSYNLYYNWQFVWIKAGSASMYTVKSNYRGQQAYRTSLITRGSDRADQYFVMRDTLLCYYTLDNPTDSNDPLRPLYYRKGAREGKRYYVDEVFYSYPSAKGVHVDLHQQTSKGAHEYRKKDFDHRVYDMLCMFQRARYFDPSGWQTGHTISFDMADGHKVETARIKFRGRTNVKADNGKTYKCLKLSYLENENGKWQEIVTFFVTDDQRHLPVRLDMNLRVGTAKAFLIDDK